MIAAEVAFLTEPVVVPACWCLSKVAARPAGGLAVLLEAVVILACLCLSWVDGHDRGI